MTEVKTYTMASGWMVEAWRGPSLKFNRWYPSTATALAAIIECMAGTFPA